MDFLFIGLPLISVVLYFALYILTDIEIRDNGFLKGLPYIKHTITLDSKGETEHHYTVKFKWKWHIVPFSIRDFRNEESAQEYIKINRKKRDLRKFSEIIYPEIMADLKFDDPEKQKLYETSIKSLNEIREVLQSLQQ